MKSRGPRIELADAAALERLVQAVMQRAPLDALLLLERQTDDVVAAVLEKVRPDFAVRILSHMDAKRAAKLSPKIHRQIGEQWSVNLGYDENSVGRIMEPPADAFPGSMTVAELIDALRKTAVSRQVVYAFVIDEDHRLIGLIVLRDLLFANPGDRLEEQMITDPFYFEASTPLEETMQDALLRHYPMYPVCDDQRHLVGQIRGYALFERRTYVLTAQSGKMVGVEKEERVGTPWLRCLMMRHPWLQLNLLTAFLAGAVVGLFEDTIARVVVLAAFLPILAGQCGNTGCQALAVTLRSMILKELKPGMEKKLFAKEAFLGAGNGMLVGIPAAIGMYAYASLQEFETAPLLALIVFLAMAGACIASGLSGVIVPLALRRLGADPVTASTIFLTTLTDVVSMGLLLLLATLILL